MATESGNEDIRKQLDDVRNDINELARMVGRNASRETTARAQELGGRLRHVVEEGRDSVMEAQQQTKEQIQQHPFFSTAGAFAIGVLVAQLVPFRCPR